MGERAGRARATGRLGGALLLGALLSGAASGAGAGDGAGAAADEASIERGRTFAEAACAQCHAIGPTGPSPLAEAPPLRDLHRLYPVEFLEEAFAEGISTGHPEMPPFRLDPDQIFDLIAYLRSLE